MLGGDNPFANIHREVIDAHPEDEQSKINLVEELKSRARGSVSRKNWPEADVLYSKAIEVKADAILYANRSLVRLNLKRTQDSLIDAESAVTQDSGYAKGYYRKGQALAALGRFGEALHAYEAGESIAPDDNSFKQMIQKMTIEIREKGPNVAETPGESPSPSPTVTQKKQSSPNQAKKSPPVSKQKKTTVTEGDEPEADEDLDNVRGYKKLADGRTTTYFNNELTEEAKALIGDIAPKKVEAPVTMNVIEGASSWNQAGTWEERDMTVWARARLQELLVPLEFELPNGLGSFRTSELVDLNGDCSITLSRGKRKFIFDFNFYLKWKGEFECGKAKGKLHFPDFSSDCNGEYEIEVQVDSSSPSQARPFIEQYLKNDSQGLKPRIFEQLQNFVSELQSK